MDGIQVECLRALRKIGLAGGCAVLGIDTHLQVLLGGVGQDFAQQLCELGGVIRFLQSSSVIVITDFRIAFTESLTAHSQIHTDFRALALKVGAQISDDILRSSLRDADNMLGSPDQLTGLCVELFLRSLADGALVISGKLFPLCAFLLLIIDITADTTYIFHWFTLL